MKRCLPILLLVFSLGVGAETIEYLGGIYTGQLVNGVPHGEGTRTWSNGGKYVGEFVNGSAHGQGTLTHTNRVKYVGEWKDWKKWEGTYYDKDGNVIATFSEGVKKSVK